MNQSISQKEIGKRISELRQLKGLSQADLADQVNISRSSLAQIELGNRKLNVIEFQLLAQILEFSLDQFLAHSFSIQNVTTEATHVAEPAPTYRVSVPTLNTEKFSNVLLYILERCAGKPNVGETLLYKMLYFSDFNYYELYEEHLIGATYHKLPYGPVPQNVQAIINDMLENKKIKRLKTRYNNNILVRYIPLEKANLQELKASETQVLDQIIAQFSDWTAKGLSDYAHQDIPWLSSKEGEAINYELALYREVPFSVRNHVESE